jgi:hypothetical protein
VGYAIDESHIMGHTAPVNDSSDDVTLYVLGHLYVRMEQVHPDLLLQKFCAFVYRDSPWRIIVT